MTDPRSDHRLERDTLGEIAVPSDALYGAATARAASWSFSGQRPPRRVLHAIARIKAAAAVAHGEAGRLDPPRAAAIEAAALEVAAGRHDAHLVVDLFQTGSGTSSHMNVNEVVARLASRMLGDAAPPVHPNDDVNRGQSSNDVVPSAVQLALVEAGDQELLPAFDRLVATLHEHAERWWHVVRDGRTHLMRATPIRVGQQFRGYAHQFEALRARLAAAIDGCRELPLGGTAVGTGVTCPDGFAAAVCATLTRRHGTAVREAQHHLGRQGNVDAVAWLAGACGDAASTLGKVVDDLRWQASDALRELALPAMQPGSSIMPGKNNPVVCEAVRMACLQVEADAGLVRRANALGQFELSTMLPLVARNALEAVELLSRAVDALRAHALEGLTVPDDVGARTAHNPMLATALASELGYERAAALAKTAQQEGRTVFEVARRDTDLDEATLRRLLDPARLAGDFGRERGTPVATDRSVSTPDDSEVRAILASATSRDDKIARLRRLAYDVRELSVAAEEGMDAPAPAGPSLAAIQAALRQLGADDVDSGAKQ